MALNFVRGMVSQDLKRHVEAAWDLNLTYIVPNLIAMSYPGEGVEGMYRNDITQVAAYLDYKHQDHYMIFNLSERNYNFDLFHGRVIDYGWPDHHGPPLQVLIDVVSNMDRWIRSHPKNVAIVHCLAGRGRTGTAICAYLCYAGYFASMSKALQYYANVRSNKGKGVTQPSQLRYCKYVDIILNKKMVPNPKTVSITRITITPVPNMTSQLGIRPILNIYRYSPGVQQLIWTSMKDTHEVAFFGPKDGEITFDISDMPPIAGDIMFKMSHVTSWMWVGSKTEPIMRLILNTSFLADGTNVLTLTKRDLDIAHKDPRFSSNTQFFLYTTAIPNSPPPPKTDWDPEKFDIWAETAAQYRAKCVAEASSSNPSLLHASSSSSSSLPDSSEISEISQNTSNASPSGASPSFAFPLKENPSTITFNPFVPPTASSTPPVPDAESLFPPRARAGSIGPAVVPSPTPAETFLAEQAHHPAIQHPQPEHHQISSFSAALPSAATSSMAPVTEAVTNSLSANQDVENSNEAVKMLSDENASTEEPLPNAITQSESASHLPIENLGEEPSKQQKEPHPSQSEESEPTVL
jgi:protein-tyrosine phosphatase